MQIRKTLITLKKQIVTLIYFNEFILKFLQLLKNKVKVNKMRKRLIVNGASKIYNY